MDDKLNTWLRVSAGMKPDVPKTAEPKKPAVAGAANAAAVSGPMHSPPPDRNLNHLLREIWRTL